MKKTLFFLVFIVTILSCKNENTSKPDSVENQEDVLDESFNVILDVIMKKDDVIALYYTTDGTADFTKIEPIWKEVKGSELVQQVVYRLPENVTQPTEFRFDFGRNPQQEDVFLKKVTFKYIGKEREIGCPELVDFFRADDNYCTFDHLTGLIHAKKGANGENLFPSLYPHEKNLLEELQKIY